MDDRRLSESSEDSMIIKDEVRPKGTGLSKVTTNLYSDDVTKPRQRLAGKPKHGTVQFDDAGASGKGGEMVPERVVPLKVAPLRADIQSGHPTPKGRPWLRRVVDTPLGIPNVLLILFLIACALLLLGYAM